MSKVTITNDLPLKWQPTKLDIARIKDDLLYPIQEGNLLVQDAAPTILALIEALEQAYEEIKPQLIEWVQQFPKGQKVSALGVELSLKEAGTRYDFSQCGDTVLKRLLERKAEIDLLVKERQDLIKKIKGSEFLTDTDTGEINEVFPPQKKSTTMLIKLFPEQ
jgi:hypothetical protein